MPMLPKSESFSTTLDRRARNCLAEFPGNPLNTTRPLAADVSWIWFYSHKDADLAKLGSATATFAGKGHDLFARFGGRIVVEESRERFDQFWNNFVKAWYPGGKDDPNMLFLRMDLGDAEIWGGDLGMLTVAKMALGKTVIDEAEKEHVKGAPL